VLVVAGLPAQRSDETLQRKLEQRAAGFEGTVSLFAKNLDTGQTVGIRQTARVRTASTIKLPVMVAVFAMVQRGEAAWDEKLRLTDDDKVSGSGVLREFSNGMAFPLRDLVHLMIVVSDNTATNLILDRITADRVNLEMERLGLKQTRSMRKILGDGSDLKPRASGHSKAGLLEENKRWGIGVSTPLEMVALLEMLENGEAVSREASKEMIAILRRQRYKDCIGRYISYPVASKSGALDALRSDVGIVYTPGGRIAMALTVDGMPKPDWSPENPGEMLLGRLAEMIVKEWEPR
jgi:beta-lactamase class A